MKSDKQTCDGKTCLLCRLSLPEWLPAIHAHKKNIVYKKNDTLFKEGDAVKGMFFVFDGVVKVHKHWGTEKDLIVRFAQKGEIVGHRGIGGPENIYPVTATAMSPVTVCYVDLDFFNASLRVNNELLYQLMLFYAKELQDAEKYMHGLAHMPVKTRLANVLLLIYRKFGTTAEGYINLPLTKQDLSECIGATYETTFRVLNELITDGFIKTEGKHLMINNVAALAEQAKAM
ncbi:cAMP-binding domain of CRP or a regulatory subunit of cAMP-dependent protein kinases [Chitinophaga jiangningensis]|uniref:cAMP-binding domain of CRP or a regulatory subunit of cAMP-dependent protein kinases n=1 Tax=Chitinophaga jiangningensis TaxID=1419482 RepID=A0A1M7N1D5_9BACT|nr:Crp/Fnr family transcriptional regulator [Chitinophaga jiangningensis]SHM97325.1 cAMP-binding domain of CRP or a regulatory subunit of cAMP-dependent protein kinases [Chitinophaga jiangningensis]